MIRLLLILSVFSVSSLIAQEAYIEAAISSTKASTVDAITYQLTTDCDCNIEAPDLSAFDILQRTPGQFTQTTNINGAVSNVCTSTLTFVLRPKKKGEIKIGQATAICENANKTSKTFNVDVVDADELHASNEGVAAFYFKIVSNKKSVYVGEPFTITLYMYTEKLPEDINNIVKGDALGMSRHPLYNEREPGHVFQQYQQKVKGKNYHVIELTKEVCFADQAGNLHIGAYYGSAVQEYRIWDNLYMEGYSNTLDIKVKEVPGEKPENYYGLAGDFEMTHEISETTIKANHAIDMKITISGTGNFHLLKAPEFMFPSDSFLISGPEIEQSLTQTENGASGNVTYHYVITPTVKGEFLILPYSFSYFDWADKKMKSVMTHDFVLNITKGEEVKTWPPRNIEEGSTETDIRYIHTKSGDFFQNSDLLFGRMIHWIGIGAPLSCFLLIIVVRRKKSKMSEEERSAGAQKIVKKSTVKDIQKLKQNEEKSGIRDLKRSLEDYFMKNLSINRSQASKLNISNLLDAKGVSKETKLSFEMIWDKIDMAQYAPMSSDNVSELFEQTEQLIQSLNKQL